jgi:hypothetical protein
MARVVVEDRVEAAERFRRQKEARRASTERTDVYDTVTVRFAGENDAEALRRLAERDGGSDPRPPLLVAEVDGALLAARSLANGDSVADPFVHSAHLVELLELRSVHLRAHGDRQPRARRLWRAREAARRLARSYS